MGRRNTIHTGKRIRRLDGREANVAMYRVDQMSCREASGRQNRVNAGDTQHVHKITSKNPLGRPLPPSKTVLRAGARGRVMRAAQSPNWHKQKMRARER